MEIAFAHLKELTRTPDLAHSNASDEAMCFTAALEALYGVWGYDNVSIVFFILVLA
jgi:hypothetical protein